MKVNVHGKDVDVSPKTIAVIEEKLEFLDKYLLIEDDDVANTVIQKVGNKIRVEVTIATKVGFLRAEVTDLDLRCALDEVGDRLEAQLKTQKNRLNRRHKDKLSKAFIEEDEDEYGDNDIPVRTKTIEAQKMSLDEAILRMEMLGHSFFIYTDEESDMISVVYQRVNGGYGLIEAEPAK
ncbi:MAG: ribosome-associated translation inhibitor RaiA [Erysipelotrichaceae bacterium]|nr:ribosome-associated translation inhibitor RaiA [Erysipelotrichaceae bacterium]